VGSSCGSDQQNEVSRRTKLIRKKARLLWSLGIANVMSLVADKLLKRASPTFVRHAQSFASTGLEIGGPSKVFAAGGYWPAYECALRVDNVNFRDTTEWHGTIRGGEQFLFNARKAPGLQLIREAGDLRGITDHSYDFILSSHMLEHAANPIGVLREWLRVLRPGGVVQLVLPHKDGTFDHRRPVTKLEHLEEDFAVSQPENDRTHFDEILHLHDLSRDISQVSADSFRAWILDNANNRGAHHHVFDAMLAARLADAVGLEVLAVEPRRPYDIFVTARKPLTDRAPDNTGFFASCARRLARSPFPSDRTTR
jgi:SAM-dependent methyltransferase